MKDVDKIRTNSNANQKTYGYQAGNKINKTSLIFKHIKYFYLLCFSLASRYSFNAIALLYLSSFEL
jgi:hypothetical protein